ncbi:MAG: cytochrome-c oxidase [Acidobacteriia bacterium]|nr:cytochrome-c oxidase [Terriglobia bacterium]
MLLAPVVWVLTVVIVYFFAAKTWWFPPPISQHGLAYDAQFMRTLIVVGIIFFLAQFALGYVIVRFRNDGRRAEYSHGNNRLETLWTSATALLFIGLVIMGTKIWAAVHFDEAPPDAIPIEVMAKQFAWSFRYPGPDGKFGRADLHLVNDSAGNPMGLDDKDPASADDIVSASLKVPVGKPINLIMHSRDVIHNFFVPELRMKQDIVPGMEIPLHFQADKIGIYEVPCSELCGLGHFQMRTTMQVMSAADFEQWKRQQAQK